MNLLSLNNKVLSLNGKILKEPAAAPPPPSGPVADFYLLPGITGPAPFSIAAYSTSEGESLTHLWDWGDGSPTENGWDGVQHTFVNPGEYDIELLVTQTTDNQTSNKIIRVTVTEPSQNGNEPPTAPGKPELVSESNGVINLSFAPGTDDTAVVSYDVYRQIETSLIPTEPILKHLGGYDTADINTDSDLIRAVFPIAPTELEEDPNGIRLKLGVTNAYPDQNTDRQELRETDIGFVPAVNTTIEYNSRFKVEDIPSVIFEPLTIMQVFDHGNGGPSINVLLTGANQFSAEGDENLIQVSEAYTGDRQKIEGVYLKTLNDLKILLHINGGTSGYFAVYLNGEMIYSKTGINTLPQGGLATQFGIYPHGFQDAPAGRADQVASGETDFSFLLHSFSKRIFPGALPIVNISTIDFNGPASNNVAGSPFSENGLAASTRYRYTILSRDGGNLRSAPSLSSSFTTGAQSGGGGSNAILLKESNFPASAQYNSKDEWRNGWDAHGLGRNNNSGAQFTSSPITINNGILNIPFKNGDWGGAGWQNTGAIIYQSQPIHTGKSLYWKHPVKFSDTFDWGVEGEQFRGGKFGLSFTVGSVGVGSNPGFGNFQVTTMWRGGGLMHLYMYWHGQQGNWPDYDIYHTVPRGQWLDFEVEVKNNDPGQSNGHVKIWIDGVLRKDLSDIQFGPGGEVTFVPAFGNFFGGNSDAWRARNDCNIQYQDIQVYDQRP